MTQPVEQQIKFKVDRNAQQRAIRDIEAVNTRLDRADEQYQQLSNRVGLAGDFQSNLGALRGLADTAGLGGLGQGLGVVGEIGVLAEELPRLKTAIQNMPDVVSAAASALGTNTAGLIGSLGIGAVALVAVTLAVNAYNASIEAQKKALEGALSAQDNYYRALENTTSKAAQQQIDQLTRSQAVVSQQMGELQGAVDSAFSQLQQNFGDGLARALVAAGQTPITQLQERLSELQTEFSTNEQTIARLKEGLESGVFAANDMRAAEEQLASTRANEAQKFLSGIEGEIRQRAELNNLIINGSQEQKRDRLNQLQIDQQIAQAQLEAAQRQRSLAQANPGIVADIISEEDLQKLRDRSQQLSDDIALLAGNLFATDQTKYWGALSDALNDNSFATKQMLGAEQQLASERKKAAADALLEANEAMVEAEAELAKLRMQEADALAEMQREISKIVSEIIAERAKVEAEAAEDRLEAAEELAEDMAEIDEDRAKSEKGARRKRDVLQAIEAREAAKDQQDDTRKAYDKQLREIQKGLDKQYKSITENAAKSAAAVDDRYRRERQTLQQAQQQAQIDLINAANAQRTIQQQIYALNRQDAYNAGLLVGQSFAAGAVAGAGTGGGGSSTASSSSLNRRIDQRVDQRLAQIFPQPTQF
jgi:hypothetical protein